MTGVAIHCQHCEYSGTVDNLVETAPGASLIITFEGNTLTCPRCRQPADILDGRFLYRDAVVRVLSAPEWSRDRLLALHGVLAEAQEQPDTDLAAVITRVAKIDETVARLLEEETKKGWSRGDVIALISLLAAVIFGVLSLLPSDDRTVRIPPEQLQQIVDQQAPASSPAGSPPEERSTPEPRTPGSPTP